MIVGIINYGLGNVKSIQNAFEYIGADTIICENKNDFNKSSHLVLPGVGAFERGINLIYQKQLNTYLHNSVIIEKKPILGICLGMQLMAEVSHEFGKFDGLSWFKGEVLKLDNDKNKKKLPNIGWESVELKKHKLFEGINSISDFYFIHSYHLKLKNQNGIIATYDWNGQKIVSAICMKNIVATQFHPEKSQDNGLIFLENFLKF